MRPEQKEPYKVYRAGGREFPVYLEYDEQLKKSYPAYPDFEERPEYTDEGRPFATAEQESCPHCKPKAPGKPPPGDCGGCGWFYRERTPYDPIGVSMCGARQIHRQEDKHMKKLNAVISILILLFLLLTWMPQPVLAAGIWNGEKTQPAGAGTSASPYQIGAAGELAWFAEKVNGNGGAALYAELTADIALNDTSNLANWGENAPANTWTPIGSSTNRFAGCFNGNNHTISGVYINNSSDCQALFGYIAYNGTVKNLKLADSYIKAGSYAGGVCGYNSSGTIENCSNSATISGGGITGGICGYNYMGTITYCGNSGTIASSGTGTQYGGICGTNYGTISNSYNTGAVYVPGKNIAGGICGFNSKTITTAYSSGTVSGNNNAGLFCGLASNVSSLSDCYFLGSSADTGIGNNGGSGTATYKSATEFSSGAVAYLLRSAFGQTLGTDALPAFKTADNSNAVYKLTYMNGSSEFAVQYYNSGNAISTALFDTPVSDSGNFAGWEGLPATMPAYDLTVTAVFNPDSPATPRITTTALAAGYTGVAYSAQIEVEGTGNLTFSVASGYLPDGLSLDPATGLISGTPALVGTRTFIVRVLSDTGAYDQQELSLVIRQSAPTITTTSLPPGTLNAPYSASITAQGITPFTFSVYSGSTDYTVSGSNVMILKSYLETLNTGNTYLTFKFSAGGDRTLTVTVADTTPPCISPDTVTYDLSSPGDVETTITWNSAQSVASVVYNSTALTENTDYVVSGNTLTIFDSYLSNQGFTKGDKAEFEITFDTGSAVTLAVDIEDNYTPNSDATLSYITVGSKTITFAPGTYSCDVILPCDTQPGSAAATVSAVATDPKAAVNIAQASSLPGSATITVTAEDNTTILTYTVNFALEAKPNNAPKARSIVPVQNVAVNGTAAFTASDIAEDADGDTLEITGIESFPDPDTASAELDSGMVTVKGISAGDTSVIVRVSDGTDAVDVTVPIAVTDSHTAGKTLISIIAPGAVTGLANGTAKTASALGLPPTVTLVTDGGNVSASVTWDVASSSYDPGNTAEQTFTVSGTVTLPDGVINPDNISLTTSISVSVLAATRLASPTGLAWDGATPGKATWSAVANASQALRRR